MLVKQAWPRTSFSSIRIQTSLAVKSWLWALQPHLEAMAEDKQARRILLHLLSPNSPCWLPPALATLVHLPKRMAAMAAQPAADDEAEESLQDAATPDTVCIFPSCCAHWLSDLIRSAELDQEETEKNRNGCNGARCVRHTADM